MRRLRAFEDENFIERVAVLDDGMNCWSLTDVGGKKIEKGNQFKHRNKNTLNHTVTLNELRFVLEKNGVGKDWTNEFDLKKVPYKRNCYDQKDYRVIPDGLIVESVFGQNHAVAVELELNLKTPSRYKRLFQQYREKKSLGLVWYLVPRSEMGLRLWKFWQQTWGYGDPSFSFSVLSDVLSDFQNSKIVVAGKECRCREVFDSLKKSENKIEIADAVLPKNSPSTDAQGVSGLEGEKMDVAA